MANYLTPSILFCIPFILFCQPGQFDETFNLTGKVNNHIEGYNIKTSAIAIQQDGKIVVCGTATKPVYVFVHGTWGGGWAYKTVDSLLTSVGNTVYRPTLTGQGERVHLASGEVGLQTHVLDIVNVILYEDLHDVILVGHSYGGMVITGVADSIPGRIRKLVYLDAFVPEHGESVLSIFKHLGDGFDIVDGFIIPHWVPEGKTPPKDVPQPVHTWTDPLILKNPDRLNISTIYILTVDRMKDPEQDDFASQALRAEKKGWPVLQLESDHNAQWSAPVALVKMLQEIASE